MSVYRKLFHEKSKNYYVPDYPESDPKTWPKEWHTTYYKEYLRFPGIKLPMVDNNGELERLLANRVSDRDFNEKPLGLEDYSQLLRYSCGEWDRSLPGTSKTLKHRIQPSGGARYPIEMYVIVLCGSEDLPAGAYHYNVSAHTLEKVIDASDEFSAPEKLAITDWAKNASALFVMTSYWWRTEVKYKERGARYAYIEAGHIGQNIYLLAEKFGLKCVALGGVWEDSLEQYLNLDTDMESCVYTLAVGK